MIMIERITSQLRMSVSFLGAVWVHLILFIVFFIRIEILEPPRIQVEHSGDSELAIELESPIEGESEKQEDKGKQEEGSDEAFAEMMELDGKKWGNLLKRLQDNTGLEKSFTDKYEDLIANGNAEPSYIYRKRHHEDLIVKEVFPTMETLELPFDQVVDRSPGDLQTYQKRNEIISKYRDWKNGELFEKRLQTRIIDNGASQSTAPLYFPKEEREKYFDRTLKQSKEDQLNEFIDRFFSYDPDKGDLPAAVRELYYDNLQRLAYSFSSDPTYFYLDYFEENLNKEDFLKNSLYQVKRLKGTKTMTELLFTIENIYEIQQRAWTYYLNFGNMYNSLPEEKKQQLRVETLRRIYERYQPMAQELEMTSVPAVVEKYAQRRLEIMDFLIQNTPQGYRMNDGLFERARIQWEKANELGLEEEMLAAVKEWIKLAAAANIDINTPMVSNEELEKEKNPFLNKNTLIKLYPYLYQYTSEDGVSDKVRARSMINSIIMHRQQERLIEKEKREDRLLWK